MDKAFKKNGLASVKMGRPFKGVGSSFDKAPISRIGHYRGLHPKWGSKTILVELSEKDKYDESDLPSAPVIRWAKLLRSLSPKLNIRAGISILCWKKSILILNASKNICTTENGLEKSVISKPFLWVGISIIYLKPNTVSRSKLFLINLLLAYFSMMSRNL
jgi:hypothetical protein